MPRLSDEMEDALKAAARHGGLTRTADAWEAHAFSSRFWTRAVDRLLETGLLRRDVPNNGIERRVITPAGREAIGMKEGEDRHA